MYYDQLLALKRDLHILLVQTINDYMITDCENEERYLENVANVSLKK